MEYTASQSINIEIIIIKMLSINYIRCDWTKCSEHNILHARNPSNDHDDGHKYVLDGEMENRKTVDKYCNIHEYTQQLESW